MDGWIDGRTDGWVDRWTIGWMDGQMNGRTLQSVFMHQKSLLDILTFIELLEVIAAL